jgi:hypothetical protein
MSTPKKFWKLRHKKSGMFFQPSKRGFDGRASLSYVGKEYRHEPRFSELGNWFYHPGDDGKTAQNCSQSYRKIDRPRPVLVEEWELVEFHIAEYSSVDGGTMDKSFILSCK